jgi:hypothetical protein
MTICNGHWWMTKDSIDGQYALVTGKDSSDLQVELVPSVTDVSNYWTEIVERKYIF